MNEKNSIDFSQSKCRGSEMKSNRSGRPTNKNLIKFGPQPKSLVSQMLKKIKDDCGGSTIRINALIKSQEKCIELSPQPKSLVSQMVKKIKDDCGSSTIHINALKKSQEKYRELENCNTINSSIQTAIDPVISAPCIDVAKTTKNCKDNKNKTYPCDFPNCKYACKLSSNLVKHKRTHTSEKPYLCHQCSFRSNFINSLKVHQRIHTAEKPYGCKFCSYRCNSSSNLKKHCKHRHSNISSVGPRAEELSNVIHKT